MVSSDVPPSGPEGEPGDGSGGGGPSGPDAALVRLEETLRGYDFERALPDLGTILSDAGISRALLREDDRAMKLLHEAIVARPLSSLESVARAHTEVELLSLEVSVLNERLEEPGLDGDEAARILARLEGMQAALADLRQVL